MEWLAANCLRVVLAASALIASLGFVRYLQDKSASAIQVERNREAQEVSVREDRLARDKSVEPMRADESSCTSDKSGIAIEV